MAAWTRFVLRFRWPILAFWFVVLLAWGVYKIRNGTAGARLKLERSIREVAARIARVEPSPLSIGAS